MTEMCMNGQAPQTTDLLVATVGRTHELARLFQSLREQRDAAFRVLVADQNPLGFLDSVLTAFPDLCIETYRVPPAGVSAARNALLPLVKADLVAFPDDDCWYAPDTLEQATAFFAANPRVGTVMAVWGQSPECVRLAGTMTAPLGYMNCFRRGETYVQFFRREVVQAVGDFDTRLGPGGGNIFGGGEDTDYLLRALRFAPVVRVPSVRVFHPEVNHEAPVQPEKLQQYAAGRMALLKKHRLPAWFCLVNVLYPLMAALCCLLAGKRNQRNYFLTMFRARLAGWRMPFPIE